MITDTYTLSFFKGQGVKHLTEGYGVVHLIPQKPETFLDGVERKTRFVANLSNLTVGFKHGVLSGISAAACLPAVIPADELARIQEKYNPIETEDEGE